MRKETESERFLNLKHQRLFRVVRHKVSRGGGSGSSRRLKNIFIRMKDINKGYKVQLGSSDMKVVVPRRFSVLDDPDSFMSTIIRFTSFDGGIIKRLHIDHTGLEEVDLGAESVLDHLVVSLKGLRRGSLDISGRLPKKQDAKRYIRATGIIERLGIDSMRLHDSAESDYRVFCSSSPRSDAGGGIGEWTERSIEGFVSHINSCLSDNDMKLTDIKKRDLARYTGEALTNASDHSGAYDITIAGFLDNKSDGRQCEITMFNFGRTIAETFLHLPTSSYTRREIDKYIRIHSKKRYFGREWSKENLRTLVALQGHISSKNNDEKEDRGQGTIDLIQFFQTLHDEYSSTSSMIEVPRMAILSGKTYICFDGSYAMDEVDGRRIIAFNKKNDLNVAPDPKCVRNLKFSFPGTIVSIRFSLRGTEALHVRV